MVFSSYMDKQTWIGIAIILLIGGALYFSPQEEAESVPLAEEGASVVEEASEIVAEEKAPVTAVAVSSFRVNVKDTIASWKFTGRYAGNETLTINAQTDIARLQSLLGTGKYPDYDLHTGIGNNYTYLGDGEKAFTAYKKAISLDPERAIIYMNIGNLMEQLGALYTAKDAYAKAVATEPGVAQYKNAEADFLAQHPELSKEN